MRPRLPWLPSERTDAPPPADDGKHIDAQAIQCVSLSPLPRPTDLHELIRRLRARRYVVIDQDDNFDPTKFGIQPLSVVAVVCGGKLTFGVWADTSVSSFLLLPLREDSG